MKPDLDITPPRKPVNPDELVDALARRHIASIRPGAAPAPVAQSGWREPSASQVDALLDKLAPIAHNTAHPTPTQDAQSTCSPPLMLLAAAAVTGVAVGLIVAWLLAL